MPSFYELYDSERDWLLGHGFSIPSLHIIKHAEEFLLACKTTEKGKILVYGYFCPAHFFKIRIEDSNGSYITFNTGSGCLDKYMRILEPFITQFFENMLVPKEIGVK